MSGKFPWPQWTARLADLAAQGMSSVKVAEHLSAESGCPCSAPMVRAKAAVLGVAFALPKTNAEDQKPAIRERLKERWAEGLSAAKVAAALSREFKTTVSRNAVLGLRQRLGLPSRQKLNGAPKKKPGRLASAIGIGFAARKGGDPKPPKLPPEREEDIPVAQRCALTDLGLGICRWPVGTPGTEGFYFCGGKTSKRPWGKLGRDACPYCDGHANRAVS